MNVETLLKGGELRSKIGSLSLELRLMQEASRDRLNYAVADVDLHDMFLRHKSEVAERYAARKAELEGELEEL